MESEFNKQAKISPRTELREKPHQNDSKREVNLSGLELISKYKVLD